MSISFSTINRVLENEAAKDEDLRRKLKRNGKCTLSDGRALSNEMLVEKLHSLGLEEFDREWLDRYSQKLPSAEALARAMTEHGGLEIPENQKDWIWISLVCLWERWFPDRPNFEMIDDLMQAGYQARKQDRPLDASRTWLQAWRGIEHLMHEFAIPTLEEFDDWIGGTQCVFNWVHDLSSELYRAAGTDPSLNRERLALCQAVLALAERSERDRKFIPTFQRALAECSAELAGEEELSSPTASDDELDQIIAELDAEPDGKLPEQALRAAQRRGREIAPRLIRLIQDATDQARHGNAHKRNGHFFAIFLLAEFRATEALPAILEAVSLPGELPLELYEDVITEDLARILADLAADSPGVIDELIANRLINEYVRWEAAQTYLYWVRDGRMTREEAVERLRGHLLDAIEHEDHEIAGQLVCELANYIPHEAREAIEQAFETGLADPYLIGPGDVEKILAEGESGFQQKLERLPPTGIPDTVEELRHWASFQPRKEPPLRRPQPSIPVPPAIPEERWDDHAEYAAGSAPIRNTAPRVGRNDPCPCGSGKKFKKCCGGR